MKNFFTLFAILISAMAFAQSTFRPSLVFTENYCTVDDIIAHSTFKNNFTTTDLRFIRVENTLTSQWTSAFCDCELCHDIYTDTANFYIPIGDSCPTSAHFYPDDKKGLGVMKIEIFDPKDRNNFVLGEFRASCWGASTTFLEKDALSVYPNPTGNRINVQFGSGEDYLLEIVSADGKTLMQENVNGLNQFVNIENLESGMYIAKVNSSGKVFYTRFVKL